MIETKKTVLSQQMKIVKNSLFELDDLFVIKLNSEGLKHTSKQTYWRKQASGKSIW